MYLNNKRKFFIICQQKVGFSILFIFSTHLINSFIFLGFGWDRGGDLDHIEANYRPDIASRLPNSPTRHAAIFAGQQLTEKVYFGWRVHVEGG